ncbi:MULTISPECIES: ABC transporter ATP-binding protein [Microbispora]|uniref:ABC transporter ATP-binding protein n=3 Tax=Microbispora TaxID=2005 RepID=A0ABY3LX83_9ACTN|nr:MULTISPECIES: ABC transporter ATP-binding protein [Microbispora]GLW24714.1 ABC transporter ATP-binding protein [Microbispora amethystogenes]MBO4274091.1 ATP-binding cassette domain-containing protein [Microbispora triticiradicis]RGA00604.1 ABC transporter ATP-binding protein [Microbispora triticiradicis]TLP55660.1 ABC transporter ATP-binding protein [Microbispora fusca]TYB57352.1 ABC transporter ATP-binding protein [Microbispora tritici]
MSDTPVVRVVNLVKIYQTGGLPVPAVRGVDLTVEAGEFVAVTGPSGSGKSTLIHMIGGLDTRTSGEIWLDGRRADTLSESGWAVLRREQIGFVFQFFNLVGNMTVADNVELPALLGGASPRHARERREYLLGELGLADRADAAPAQLSGGEQQRVALARALANQPRLLLADEPTGNLDSRNTRDVLRLLGRVHRQGQTIVLVTHDARVASMADRVVSLLDGQIVDDGAIPRVRRRPPGGAGDVVELRS